MRGIITLGCFFFALAPWAAWAQPGPIESRPGALPRPTGASGPRVNLRANANLVVVPVEVVDKKNRPVVGLAKDNFKVFDDQVEQPIVTFAMEDDPLALCIVYDVSSSMGGNTSFAWRMAHEVTLNANPGDELCAVTLASEARLAIPLTADEGSRDVDQKLFEVKGGGSTALLDRVYIALNELRKSKKTKKAMFIVSDGLDNHSRYSEREVLRAIQESDAMIYAQFHSPSGIGRGYDDKEVLHDLTRATGGLFLPNVDRVITDLRNKYILGFAPSDEPHDGRYHRLLVKLELPKGVPKVTAHWRVGYYTPSN